MDGYLKDAAKLINLSDDELANYLAPERIIEVTIPLERDGKIELFRGYRVQHSSRRGPYKGGLRYHTAVDMEEAELLANLMTWKNAVADLPLGGGKGGIGVNPKELSKGELEALTRGFVRRIADVIGPEKDIPAPDVNTTPEIMTWIREEYEIIVGHPAPGVVTGKPVGQGGSAGREQATGEGGAHILNRILKNLEIRNSKFETKNLSVAIQGFGNVAVYLGLALEREGYSVVAFSNSKGGVYRPEGFNVSKIVSEIYKNDKTVQDITEDHQNITNQELLELDVDILAPSAIDNQITKANAKDIKAPIILEMANNPTTPEGDKILTERGTVIIPDILASGGGVTVSYFEWLQNQNNENWDEATVLAKLKEAMVFAANSVWQKKEKYQVSLRIAAYILALERLVTK